MSKILKVKNVSDYSHYVGAADFHPWVNVIDFAEVSPVRHCLNNYGVYGIFLHDESEIDLAYGRGKYDYHKGALICVAPGQIGGPIAWNAFGKENQRIFVFRLSHQRGPAHD